MHQYVIHYVMQDITGRDPWPKKVVAKEVATANEDASVKVANVAVQVAAVDREVAARLQHLISFLPIALL